MEHEYKLYACGTRGSIPVSGAEYAEFGGDTTCFVFSNGSHAVVVDCGTGLRRAYPILEPCSAVDVIFTHVHYDHVLGLMGPKTFPPTADVRFYGRFSQWFETGNFDELFRTPFWPFVPQFKTYVDVHDENSVDLQSGVKAILCPANHPNISSIVRIELPGKNICCAFDYEYDGFFPDHVAEGCDVMVYDGMFTKEQCITCKGWGHSCWNSGCAVAQRLGIPNIYITHHAPGHDDAKLRHMEKEAQAVRKNIRFLRDGDVITL
ncbi:MAG: MBL fold metallo-hydrolase [Eubacteriales bacterium]